MSANIISLFHLMSCAHVAGHMRLVSMVYSLGIVTIQFTLCDPDVGSVLGQRTFSDTVSFKDTQDLMDELWNSDNLTETTT